ncbi:MAG: S1C family serine protease [Candidatus Dormibacteria bacterium]
MSLAEELEQAAAAVRSQAMTGVVGVGGRWPSGSGLVVAEGVVATSAHNAPGETVEIHFPDGSRRQATKVTSDLAGDLAAVSVDTQGAAPLTWAARAPELGTPVFAAANPGGRGPRLSFGVVSAESREFRGPGGRPVTGGFEHTAPLPHGASGGPVLNLAGQLLGINTKRLGEGLYAALLADQPLRERIDALSRGEHPTRAYLGVGVLPGEVARRLRAAVGLPEQDGLLVRHLDAEGPAAQAGVLRGDLLTSLDGSGLGRASDIHRVLAGHKPGDGLELELIRGTDQLRLRVTLGAEPEGEAAPHRRHHSHQGR